MAWRKPHSASPTAYRGSSLSERFVGLTQLCPAFFIRTGVIRCAEFYFTFVCGASSL